MWMVYPTGLWIQRGAYTNLCSNSVCAPIAEMGAVQLTIKAENIVDMWDMKMTWAVDTIAPGHALSSHGVQNAPWFTEELQMMKQLTR